MKKIHIAVIALVVVVLAVSCVGFMQLSKPPATFEHVDVPLEEQEINGLFKIKAPVGSHFEFDSVKGKNHTTFKNFGKYDTEVMHLIYTPYKFEMNTPATKLVERNDNYTVYTDSFNVGLYFVDRNIGNITVSVSGYDLELLKEMSETIEISH